MLSFFSANTQAQQGIQLPDGFAAELIATGLNPVAFTIDHHSRIWVIEKHGDVRIVDHGVLLPDPFIRLEVDDRNERGLLGIALHPDFDHFPFVYLYYTVPDADHNRLSRFIANGDLALPGSEEILMDFEGLTGSIHNGGALLFGQDGQLYLALGDGGRSINGQRLETTFGKMLRLHPDGSIPNDNPWYDELEGDRRAIWVNGLRNPFSMAIAPISGQIFVGDVGGANYEEINEIIRGKNYGWKIVEGPISTQTPPDNYQDPFYAYDHTQGCAIVGTTFYQPEFRQFPEVYHDQFFFADYCGGYIKMIDPNSGTVADTFASGIERPLALQVDSHTGELYFLARAGLGGGSQEDNTATREGTLWRVFYQGSGAPFIAVPPFDQLVSVGEDASFQVITYGDQPLSYLWQIDGSTIPGAFDSQLILNNVSLLQNGAAIRCIARNDVGSDTSIIAVLTVSPNQRPVPIIEMPIEGTTFRAGDSLFFQGHANDPEEGLLSPQSLTWTIDWHHDQHTHPVLDPISGISGGTWVVPINQETDPDVWYRIYLSATDSEGFSQTTFTEIFPELATINMEGTPGVPINIDGLLRSQPYSFESLVGVQRTLEAPLFYDNGDTLFFFQNWSNGDTALIQVFQTPEAGLSISAFYEVYPLGKGIGLYGQYFNDPELDLDGDPVMTRIDSIISYQWGAGSPAETIVPNDFFTVKWSGEVQAVFGGLTEFYIHSDDGARLWVNNELLIDNWLPQPPTEFSGSIELEAGKFYPIKLEYMEVAGGAEIALSWSNQLRSKEIIPSRQLYPVTNTASVRGEVWLDENRNDFLDINERLIENVSVLLYSMVDTSIWEVTATDENGLYHFDFLPDGLYYLHFLENPIGDELESGTGLMDSGETPLFLLSAGEHKVLNVSFYPLLSSANLGIDPSANFHLFPNPTAEDITLQWEIEQSGRMQLQLTNMSGQIVKDWNFPTVAGSQKKVLSLSNLSPGFYHLSIHYPMGLAHRHLVKMK